MEAWLVVRHRARHSLQRQLRSGRNQCPVSAGIPSVIPRHVNRGVATERPSGLHATLDLNSGWSVCSSAELEVGGAALSLPGIDTRDWCRVDLPSTVLGALMAARRVEDPFFGTNLLRIPGQGPPGRNFSNHPMPE